MLFLSFVFHSISFVPLTLHVSIKCCYVRRSYEMLDSHSHSHSYRILLLTFFDIKWNNSTFMLLQLRKDTYSINSATTVSQTQKTNYDVWPGWGDGNGRRWRWMRSSRRLLFSNATHFNIHTYIHTYIQHNDDNFCLNLILFAMQFGTHSFHSINNHFWFSCCYFYSNISLYVFVFSSFVAR